MEQAGIGDIRLIILGVARRPTAYAASTGRAAACLVGLSGGIFAQCVHDMERNVKQEVIYNSGVSSN